MESPRSAFVARLFDRVAGAYDGAGVPWFTPIARRLVQEVGPRPGQRALDIGCGRGAALFALAEAVGPDGRVTGVDVAPGMVEAVRADAAERGLSTVDAYVMDADRLDADRLGNFDIVVGSMMVFFLPDPVAALRSWRDLLIPGGRLGISTMGPRDAVRTSTVDMQAVFDGAEHGHEWSRSHAGRAMWASVPGTELPGIMDAVSRHLDGLRGADGRIRLGQPILFTVAEPWRLPHRPHPRTSRPARNGRSLAVCRMKKRTTSTTSASSWTAWTSRRPTAWTSARSTCSGR
jgi:ubiquinone/menaquinone biosynthesis C-methylase UbiE